MEKAIQKAKILQEALPYIKEFYGKTFLVKYGGSAMTDKDLRNSFIKDIVLLSYIGIKIIIVHGGGPLINEMLQKLNIKTEFVKGIRKTDKDTMEIVEMVLSGHINKDIVSLINKQSGNEIKSIGISGRDGNLIVAKKMSAKEYFEDIGIKDLEEELDLGYVGKIVKINKNFVEKLLLENFIPVIAPIGVDENGNPYNINADMAASELAKALKVKKLIFLSDTDGIYDKNKNIIKTIDSKKALELIKEKVIDGGMIPKVKSAIEALKEGVEKVHLINGKISHSILLEIFTDEGIGTEIIL